MKPVAFFKFPVNYVVDKIFYSLYIKQKSKASNGSIL